MAISPRLATRRLRIRCDGPCDHRRCEEIMSRPKPPALAALLLLVSAAGFSATGRAAPRLVILIHGGAGVIEPARMTPAKEASYRAGLAAALDAGYDVLARGGNSIDAVTAAVRIMEDD